MNPDTIPGRNFKTKEIATTEFILAQFPGLTWLLDKTIPDGCSLRRPDMTLDLGSHVLFVEIDENGHESGYTCQTKRLCELFQDVGMRPVIFVRFNPDKYTNDQHQAIKSCWTHNAKGLSVIQDQTAWQARLAILAKSVAFHIATVPEKLITIEQLFFTATAKSTTTNVFKLEDNNSNSEENSDSEEYGSDVEEKFCSAAKHQKLK
jgi:hypothetical protein